MHDATNGGLVMGRKYEMQRKVMAVAAALHHGRCQSDRPFFNHPANIDTERPFQGATAKTPISGLSPRSSTDME